uniref:Uncharacterized protein n=1 Tax=Anguilla anguilla TaxID=7936 RepID=A0A0E9V9L2_ANGAN
MAATELPMLRITELTIWLAHRHLWYSQLLYLLYHPQAGSSRNNNLPLERPGIAQAAMYWEYFFLPRRQHGVF